MLILMGPSASGKTEIAKILESKYHLKKVVTHTTRDMRVNETNDIDYHFVSKETFLKMRDNNEFVETTLYNNNFYGTSKKEIADNKCVVLDPNGALSFKALNDDHIYIIYLECSEETRIKRMHSRRDLEEKIISRIASDHKSFNHQTSKMANVVVDSEFNSVEAIADISYALYTDYLKHLKNTI